MERFGDQLRETIRNKCMLRNKREILSDESGQNWINGDYS